jgi:hypothetical protein
LSSNFPAEQAANAKNERPSQGWTLVREFPLPDNYVLMCFRLALRAFALAGRLPWFAFFNFFADLAISVFLFSLSLRCSDGNPFSAATGQSLTKWPAL